MAIDLGALIRGTSGAIAGFQQGQQQGRDRLREEEEAKLARSRQIVLDQLSSANTQSQIDARDRRAREAEEQATGQAQDVEDEASTANFYRTKYSDLTGADLPDSEIVRLGRARDASLLIEDRQSPSGQPNPAAELRANIGVRNTQVRDLQRRADTLQDAVPSARPAVFPGTETREQVEAAGQAFAADSTQRALRAQAGQATADSVATIRDSLIGELFDDPPAVQVEDDSFSAIESDAINTIIQQLESGQVTPEELNESLSPRYLAEIRRRVGTPRQPSNFAR